MTTKRDGFDAYFGAQVERFRTDMGLSLDDLAIRMSQTVQWVRELELGGIRIGSAHIKALAQAMNLAVSDFFEPVETEASRAQRA